MVGDADQSIYAFRGATIRNILQFEEDYPDATTILLEQNYRSTQTILSAANAVIERNESRRPKNLWTDAGPGRPDHRLRRRHRARRGAVRRRRDRPAHRQGRGQGGRRRRLLPHQRAVPCLRRDLHPGRPALQGRRRRPLLRAQGGQGRPGLSARPVQRRGHRPAAPHPQRAQARHRRARRSDDRRPVAAREDHLPAGAAPRRRGVRHGGPLGQRRQALQRADGGAAHDRRLRAPGPRSSSRRSSNGPATSPSCRPPPTRRTRPASRTSRNSPPWPWSSSRSAAAQRAGTGRRGHARRVPGEGRPGRRLRPDPRRGRGRLRSHHPDDAAHRQGPRIPRRVPHRHGGRRLPAHARARPGQGAGGGAPPRVRRHHARPRAAVSDPLLDAQRLGPALVQPGRRASWRRSRSSTWSGSGPAPMAAPAGPGVRASRSAAASAPRCPRRARRRGRRASRPGAAATSR